MKKTNFVAFVVVVLLTATTVIPQSGGQFVIEKSVIANGGDRSTGGFFTVTGTTGQSVAGVTSAGGAYEVGGGFWGAGVVTPTSGTISGRVTTPTGQGLRNTVVSLIDSSGIRRTATTSSFGLYSFDNVSFGQSYTVTVASKRFRFAPQILSVSSSLSNIDFVGLE